MIDRYVTEAVRSTGTRVPLPEPVPRAARGSAPPAMMVADCAMSDFEDEVTGVFARAHTHDTLYER